MKCELCKKNSATIHIQEIINGQKKSLHICPECAAKKTDENPVLQGINLAEMLYNLSDQISDKEDQVVENQQDDNDSKSATAKLTCENCNWDTGKFRKTGRLGCEDCYGTFKEILSSALKNMHRGMLHMGKHPGIHENKEGEQVMLEIMTLQKKLDDHIGKEEYEKAAEIRDKISDLKGKL